MLSGEKKKIPIFNQAYSLFNSLIAFICSFNRLTLHNKSR